MATETLPHTQCFSSETKEKVRNYMNCFSEIGPILLNSKKNTSTVAACCNHHGYLNGRAPSASSPMIPMLKAHIPLKEWFSSVSCSAAALICCQSACEKNGVGMDMSKTKVLCPWDSWNLLCTTWTCVRCAWRQGFTIEA